MSDVAKDPKFLADLNDPALSIRQVANKWGKSFGFVQSRRKKVGVSHVPGPAKPIPSKGDKVSEGSTNPDGSQSVMLTADTAWGFEDWCEWLRAKGQDPDTVTFSWGVTTNPQGGFWNKLNNVKPKPGLESAEKLYTLPEARKAAAKLSPGKVKPVKSNEAYVVVLADFQIGKTGRRGGTPELMNRVASVKAGVLEDLKRGPAPRRIALFDLGDMIEGFESGGNPMFTNDLSLADQLDLYATVLLEFITELEPIAPMDIAVVCSNHSAWRNGKQNLGRPSDDFGIFVHKQVQKMCEMAGLDVTFNYPDEYDESICIDVNGTPIGAVHGNQFGHGKAIDWWQGQAFGNQAVTHADVMVSGHYHSFGAGVAGINPHTGRERMWLGAPTLDSGSDWYRSTKGRDSEPGVMTFWVDEAGFNLGSLKLV